MPKERVGQMWRPADPLDALVGLGDHLGQGRREVRLANSTAFRLDHSPSVGFSSGAYAGSRSTTSQDRWVFNQARIAPLRWDGSPSHNKVAFSPPRNRRNSLRTSIRVSVS